MKRADSMSKRTSRTDLNRALYLNARALCAWKNSEEAIRTIRDNAVMTVTLHTRGDMDKTADYKVLTIAELQGACDYLKIGKKILETLDKTVFPKRNQFATAAQKRTMFYNVFACGVYYAETSAPFTDTDTGEIMDGEELKQWRIKSFDNGVKLPSGIAQTVYDWAIPKIWELLVEGKHRALPKGVLDFKHDRLKKIDWNTITREEADAIIKYFRAMNNTITSKYSHTKNTKVYYG